MRAEPVRRSAQEGFFLIEAMVAILIFALGILGLVAMGGTAVSSQSDAQYRTEASALADAIAGAIAVNLTRTNESTKAPSLNAFLHQEDTGLPYCQFSGTQIADPNVAALLSLAASRLPGATATNQQITIANGVGEFNRVAITLCWKTASDSTWRRHTLVTYVN